MTAGPGVPDGFTAVRSTGATLIGAEDCLEALLAAGLQTPDGWERRLDPGAGSAGRGGQGRLEVPDGELILKQMRRGGLAAGLWRDRYPGTGRLLANLLVPLEVLRRGVATARPAALLLVPGPPGLHRGYLATRWIEGAEDLSRRFASVVPPLPAEIEAVMALVRRMHDAGIEHPDLNLGNLLLAAGGGAYVIDLDRVALHDGPLSFAARQRALRRIERSFVKLFGDRIAAPDWYGAYAADEPALVEGFRRGRPAGRWLQRLHRVGWRGGS